MAFPASLDSLSRPVGTNPLISPLSHTVVHNELASAVEALEAKVGIDSSVPSSLDYLLRSAPSVNPGHEHTVTALTDFPSQTGNLGKFLTTNGSALSWATTVGTHKPALGHPPGHRGRLARAR
jgi:hypothetical protein